MDTQIETITNSEEIKVQATRVPTYEEKKCCQKSSDGDKAFPEPSRSKNKNDPKQITG